MRRAFVAYPLSAALKEILADHTGQRRWRHLRPPLQPLSDQQARALKEELEQIGFSPAAVP